MPGRRNPSKTATRGRKITLALAATLLFAGGLYLGIQFAKPPPPPDLEQLVTERRAAESTDDESAEPTADAAHPQVEGEEGDGAATATVRQPAPGAGGRPKIALVIDDLGRSVDDVERLAAIGVPITASVLPFEARTPQVVAELKRRGFEYLCHLPMAARGGADPGPGALLPTMSDGELRAMVTRALDAVPGARGVNNHMGSAVMSDARALGEILALVQDRGLYFIDSRTSVETLGYTLARRRGMPAAERQVFLDTRQDADFVRGQWQELLASARRRGTALAIAHPHDVTLGVLSEGVPEALRQGFDFVTVSEILER